jgi:hypothetical protein
VSKFGTGIVDESLALRANSTHDNAHTWRGFPREPAAQFSTKRTHLFGGLITDVGSAVFMCRCFCFCFYTRRLFLRSFTLILALSLFSLYYTLQRPVDYMHGCTTHDLQCLCAAVANNGTVVLSMGNFAYLDFIVRYVVQL